MAYWQNVKAEAARLSKATEPLRAEMAKIQADKDMIPEARERRVAELRREMAVAFDKARPAAEKHVEDARAAWLYHMPSAIQRRAALSKPSRAAEIRALVAGAPLHEVEAVARELAARKDAAGAYGLRQALAERFADGSVDASDQEVVKAISAVVDATDTTGWEQTRASLVAAQVALAEFDLHGPDYADTSGGIFADPGRALRRAREARVVPQDETGATAVLSEKDAQRALEIAGMREPVSK